MSDHETPDHATILRRIVMAWDTDDSLEFLAGLHHARLVLGLKRADTREEAEDIAVLKANGYQP
jgi:hypothetical protein